MSGQYGGQTAQLLTDQGHLSLTRTAVRSYAHGNECLKRQDSISNV